MFYKSQEVLSF